MDKKTPEADAGLREVEGKQIADTERVVEGHDASLAQTESKMLAAHHARVRAAIRQIVKRIWGIELAEPFDEFRPPGHPNIVFDPKRKFGEPYIAGVYIKSEFVFDQWRAEGATDSDIDLIAEWYEIPISAVEAAIAFHSEYPHLWEGHDAVANFRVSGASENQPTTSPTAKPSESEKPVCEDVS
jgi:uncharacterized protein (DUF433 family)